LRNGYEKEAKFRKRLPKQLYSFDSNKRISAYDKEYDFNSLEVIDVISEKFSATVDGKETNVTSEKSYWSGTDTDGEFLFMSKDGFGNIDYINIADHSMSSSTEYPGMLEEVVYDDVKEKTIFSMGQDYIVTPYTDPHTIELINNPSNVTDDNEEMEDISVFTTFGCSSYKVIELAVVYDATFCSWAGGSSNAWNKINQIVSMASAKYQQDLCMYIKISALEGHCNYSQDPYRKMRTHYSGCAYKGLLQDFTKYWHYNRKYIPRDAAHLFVGKKFTDGMIGCAGIGTLCKYAYGVAAIPWTNDIKLQSNLFAHELAHNCGAVHINDPDNVMNSYITHSYDGFSQSTKNNIINYLKYHNCV